MNKVLGKDSLDITELEIDTAQESEVREVKVEVAPRQVMRWWATYSPVCIDQISISEVSIVMYTGLTCLY